MLSSSDQPPFGITHPLGLPRPLDPRNFFGAKPDYFSCNQMPIPSGCLAHFDHAVYRPHLHAILAFLQAVEIGWDGLALLDEPPRYCLLRAGVPTPVPHHLRRDLPEPPRVPLQTVLAHLASHRQGFSPLELLDVLTLISEDLGTACFATATARHPWVAEFLQG